MEKFGENGQTDELLEILLRNTSCENGQPSVSESKTYDPGGFLGKVWREWSNS